MDRSSELRQDPLIPWPFQVVCDLSWAVMSWIQTVPFDAAEGELRELYAAAVDPRSGELDHILQIHALHPAGLRAHLQLYQAVMRGSKSLPVVDRELIALTVSLRNQCHY